MNFIEQDVFDIAKRLKEIDETYRLHYNARMEKFELYGGKEQKLLLVFPYDTMDARMTEYARKTRVERMDALIKEIDEYNEQLKADGTKAGVKQFMEATEKVKSICKK